MKTTAPAAFRKTAETFTAGAKTLPQRYFVSPELFAQEKQEIFLNQQFSRMIVVTQYMKDELLRNGFAPEKIEIHPPVPRMGDPNLRSNFSE